MDGHEADTLFCLLFYNVKEEICLHVYDRTFFLIGFDCRLIEGHGAYGERNGVQHPFSDFCQVSPG